MRSFEVDLNIDFSVLIKILEFVLKFVVDLLVVVILDIKVLSLKLGKFFNFIKDSMKFKRVFFVRKVFLFLSWIKVFVVRFLVFALTLCFRYLLKSCKRRIFEFYKIFFYSR